MKMKKKKKSMNMHYIPTYLSMSVWSRGKQNQEPAAWN